MLLLGDTYLTPQMYKPLESKDRLVRVKVIPFSNPMLYSCPDNIKFSLVSLSIFCQQMVGSTLNLFTRVTEQLRKSSSPKTGLPIDSIDGAKEGSSIEIIKYCSASIIPYLVQLWE